ncbi:MAG: hypothetical protein Q7V63_02895 [Gammaproteobacteria bacterium]|nr:hypothetical protein [Gammaproteobacteria bacterium]
MSGYINEATRSNPGGFLWKADWVATAFHALLAAKDAARNDGLIGVSL